jgi:hypothetical protein
MAHKLTRCIAAAARRYARRKAHALWMYDFCRQHDRKLPPIGYRVTVRKCHDYGAPFPLPPQPWYWHEPALGKWVGKWVWYDDLLCLEWEAEMLLNRLRILEHRAKLLTHAANSSTSA